MAIYAFWILGPKFAGDRYFNNFLWWDCGLVLGNWKIGTSWVSFAEIFKEPHFDLFPAVIFEHFHTGQKTFHVEVFRISILECDKGVEKHIELVRVESRVVFDDFFRGEVFESEIDDWLGVWFWHFYSSVNNSNNTKKQDTSILFGKSNFKFRRAAQQKIWIFSPKKFLLFSKKPDLTNNRNKLYLPKPLIPTFSQLSPRNRTSAPVRLGSYYLPLAPWSYEYARDQSFSHTIHNCFPTSLLARDLW